MWTGRCTNGLPSLPRPALWPGFWSSSRSSRLGGECRVRLRVGRFASNRRGAEVLRGKEAGLPLGRFLALSIVRRTGLQSKLVPALPLRSGRPCGFQARFLQVFWKKDRSGPRPPPPLGVRVVKAEGYPGNTSTARKEANCDRRKTRCVRKVLGVPKPRAALVVIEGPRLTVRFALDHLPPPTQLLQAVSH